MADDEGGSFCAFPNCVNDPAFCGEHGEPKEYDLVQALWQVFYHNELDEVAEAVSSFGAHPQITANDDPRLIKLAQDIIRRYEVYG